MFEPLAIGNCTLKAEVSDERRTKNSSGRSGVNVARGSSSAKVSAPTTMTLAMYQRARGGRSLSNASSIIGEQGERRMRRWLTVVVAGTAVVLSSSVAQGQTSRTAAADGPRSYAGIVGESAFGNVTSQSFGLEGGFALTPRVVLFAEGGRVLRRGAVLRGRGRANHRDLSRWLACQRRLHGQGTGHLFRGWRQVDGADEHASSSRTSSPASAWRRRARTRSSPSAA